MRRPLAARFSFVRSSENPGETSIAANAIDPDWKPCATKSHDFNPGYIFQPLAGKFQGAIRTS